jgi:hypothetical protein
VSDAVKVPISLEDASRYRSVLVQIRERTEAVRAVIISSPVKAADLEVAALNLRTMIELVALGSLVANRPEAEKVASALHKKRLG